MTTFPVTVPRHILGATRAYLIQACKDGALDKNLGGHFLGMRMEAFPAGLRNGTVLRLSGRCDSFDQVYMAIGRPSYADMLAKVALVREQEGRGPSIAWVHCPHYAPVAGTRMENLHSSADCLDFVPPAEHIRHPIQGAHFGHSTRTARLAKDKIGVTEKSYHDAAEYGANLLDSMRAFVRGEAALPDVMFHYADRTRTEERLRNVSTRLLTRDDERRACGLAITSSLPAAEVAADRQYMAPSEDKGFELTL